MLGAITCDEFRTNFRRWCLLQPNAVYKRFFAIVVIHCHVENLSTCSSWPNCECHTFSFVLVKVKGLLLFLWSLAEQWSICCDVIKWSKLSIQDRFSSFCFHLRPIFSTMDVDLKIVGRTRFEISCTIVKTFSKFCCNVYIDHVSIEWTEIHLFGFKKKVGWWSCATGLNILSLWKWPLKYSDITKTIVKQQLPQITYDYTLIPTASPPLFSVKVCKLVCFKISLSIISISDGKL